MPDEPAGFKIWDVFYPWPTTIRTADPVLVVELTGMDFLDWAEALDDPDVAARNPVVRLGLIGVAVWQANPRWSRAKVIKWLEQLDSNELEFTGGDEEEAEPGPPVESSPPDEPSEEEDDPSLSQPSMFNGSADTESEPSSPTFSGSPG